MSPELIDPSRVGLNKSRRTKSSDCYALGMVIYETISGKLPFHDCTDLHVFLKVLGGERPRREVMFKESLWEMMELCWSFQPDDRPTIEDVLLRLRTAQDSSELSTLGMGGGVGSGVSTQVHWVSSLLASGLTLMRTVMLLLQPTPTNLWQLVRIVLQIMHLAVPSDTAVASAPETGVHSSPLSPALNGTLTTPQLLSLECTP